jgi:hypothetical protein
MKKTQTTTALFLLLGLGSCVNVEPANSPRAADDLRWSVEAFHRETEINEVEINEVEINEVEFAQYDEKDIERSRTGVRVAFGFAPRRTWYRIAIKDATLRYQSIDGIDWWRFARLDTIINSNSRG